MSSVNDKNFVEDIKKIELSRNSLLELILFYSGKMSSSLAKEQATIFDSFFVDVDFMEVSFLVAKESVILANQAIILDKDEDFIKILNALKRDDRFYGATAKLKLDFLSYMARSVYLKVMSENTEIIKAIGVSQRELKTRKELFFKFLK